MNAWGLTDRGKVRSSNQDSFYLDIAHEEGHAILVVCDGMGGARAGNVASELAVESFVDEVRRLIKPGVNNRFLRNTLDHAVTRANHVVYEKSRSSEDFIGMGTTLVGAIATAHLAVIANVGDSRAYLINREGIFRVTRDHSVVEDLLGKGEITPQEARNHPSKNLITRALGTEPEINCDLFSLELRPDDILLLCSDGLTNVVEEAEILYEVLQGADLSSSCTHLLALANARGGPDNITIVIASF